MRAMTQDPLRPLLEAAREGDDRAVRALVVATQPVVWRLCVVLGSPGEEDDLVQETYLRALRSLHTFRGDAPVQAWLLAVARHVCADHVRSRRRQRRLADRLLRTAARETGLDVAASALTGAELLTSLAAEQREAFELTQMVGLSYEEAATVIGCPIGTVRSRVARARTALLAAVSEAHAV